MEWLTEGSGERLQWTLGLGLLVLAAALFERQTRWSRSVLVLAAAGATLGGLVTVSLAVLMERALAAGVLVSCLAYFRKPSLRTSSSAGAGRATQVLILGTVGASLYYVYALFMTRGEGYPLLRSLGEGLRDGHGSWLSLWVAAVLALGATAATLERPAWQRLALCSLPGAVIAALGAKAAGFVLIPTVLVLGGLILPRVLAVRGPLRGPATLALPCIVSGLLFGHSYSARVLSCPPADDPRLELLAQPGEVFRIALGQRGQLALSLREDQRFGWLDPDSEKPEIRFAGAGPLKPPWAAETSQLFGTPEELVYAPSLDGFFGSVIPGDPDAWLPEAQGPTSSWNAAAPRATQGESRVAAGASVIRNVLARLNGDLSHVEDAFGLPGLCWVNTLKWNDSEELLYIGCEEMPGLHRYDPATRGLVDSQLDPRMGDVQDLVFGQGKQQDSLFSISLWRSRFLTELDRESLTIRRQVAIGGTHYHLAYAPEPGLLFASSYYGGRIHVIDAETLELRGSLRGDFGTRAVAVHPGQGLLLASSTYAGTLRIWSLRGEEPEFLRTFQVGGHVKDIQIDPTRARAWTWSQCGLYSIDLSGL
jgi:hypothetical protein